MRREGGCSCLTHARLNDQTGSSPDIAGLSSRPNRRPMRGKAMRLTNDEVEKLFRRHNSALNATARRTARSEDADDIVQSAYLRLLEMDDAAHITNAKFYLFRIVSNMAIDWLRKQRAQPAFLPTSSMGDSKVPQMATPPRNAPSWMKFESRSPACLSARATFSCSAMSSDSNNQKSPANSEFPCGLSAATSTMQGSACS